MGEKGEDHDIIERLFAEELNYLSKGKFPILFSRYFGKPVYIHPQITSMLCDQPERRGQLKLLAGNANLHSRWGYILDCKQIAGKLRSCADCSESIDLEYTDMFFLKPFDPKVIYEW